MRNTRKWLVLLLTIAMLVNTLGISAMAAENESPIALQVWPAAEPGSTVQVQIVAAEPQTVADGKLVVTYDADKLTYADAGIGAAWPEDDQVTLSVNPASGKVILAFANADAASAGVLFTLTFTAGEAGTASVSLDGSSYITGVDADLRDEAAVTITAQCVSVKLNAGTHGVFADGSAETTVKAAAGATLTADMLPPVLADAGYALTGWETADGTVIGLDELNMTAEEGLTLTAQYAFSCDGGAGCPSAQFVDLDGLFPEAHNAVDYMVINGYMNGMSQTVFGPHVDLNRAMMVTILYRIAGQPAVEGTPAFTDVPAGEFYTDPVVWATEGGITTGVSANLFAPGKSLTRQELVTFLYRFAEYMGYDRTAAADLSAYTDAAKVQPYAVEAFQWAVANGIIKGVTETTLEPEATTTRAQVCLMVCRMIAALD